MEAETLRQVRADRASVRHGRGQHESDLRFQQRRKTQRKGEWLRAQREIIKQDESERRYKQQYRASGGLYVLNERTAEWARDRIRQCEDVRQGLFDGRVPSINALLNLLRRSRK
jgi:hypothetical protein